MCGKSLINVGKSADRFLLKTLSFRTAEGERLSEWIARLSAQIYSFRIDADKLLLRSTKVKLQSKLTACTGELLGH